MLININYTIKIGDDVMKYNFDEVVERRGTDSKKWANLKENYGHEDSLPMWVADMDFKSPKEVIDALKERVEHGVFGYIGREDSFYDSVIKWVKDNYDWEIKKEWILFTPGVVMGLNIGVRELVAEGGKVLVQPPVYPPFFNVITNNDRVIDKNELIHDGEKYVMDYDDLEEKLSAGTKLMMVCNPQNPVGRVWSPEELNRLGDIAIKNDVTIISDDIHGDLTLSGIKYTPLASLSKELEDRTITLIAPSKTFNIAGLVTSVAIIPNEELRGVYAKAIEAMEIDTTSIFGALALEVAYNEGGEWLDQVMEYIESNMDYVLDYIEKNIPQVKTYKPEGTYLMWLDFNGTGKSADKVQDALLNVGKVVLNDGRPYGADSDGFFRLNVACTRANLEEGLKRIERAVNSLK